MKLFHSALYVGALGIAAHFIGEALDRGRFDENAYPFAPRKWENGGRIYRRLGIRRWKDKMPDMSRVLPDMFPKKLTEADSVEMVSRLIKETCVAEFIHNCLSILFLIGIWLIHDCSMEGFSLGVFAVLCNLPYVIIQRYNRPMLMRYLDRLKRKQRMKVAVKVSQANEESAGTEHSHT